MCETVIDSIGPVRMGEKNTVKYPFYERSPAAHFDSLNRDFLMWNSILVTRFCTLNRDFYIYCTYSSFFSPNKRLQLAQSEKNPFIPLHSRSKSEFMRLSVCVYTLDRRFAICPDLHIRLLQSDSDPKMVFGSEKPFLVFSAARALLHAAFSYCPHLRGASKRQFSACRVFHPVVKRSSCMYAFRQRGAKNLILFPLALYRWCILRQCSNNYDNFLSNLDNPDFCHKFIAILVGI